MRKCAAYHSFIRFVAGAAVFCICFVGIPVQALEQDRAVCTLNHVHDERCCVSAPADTSEIASVLTGAVLHAHNELCFRADGSLICPLPDAAEHIHEDACYETRTVPAHTHTERCYTKVRQELTCTTAEMAGHIHSAACYEEVVPQTVEAHDHTAACYSLQKGQLTCTIQEYFGHTHGQFCYIRDAICGAEENADHTHTDSCYSRTLVCQTPENAGHTHMDSCFEWVEALSCEAGKAAKPEIILVCFITEQPGHTHDDSCYRWEKNLSCGKEELPAGSAVQEKVLICERTELTKHIHGDGCYEVDAGGVVNQICTQQQVEEHQHQESCLVFSDADLLCEKEVSAEHAHTRSCYRGWSYLCWKAEEPDNKLEEAPEAEPDNKPEEAPEEKPESKPEETPEEAPVNTPVEIPESDPLADKETAKQWEKTFSHVKLTGAWAYDLLEIAQTQLGYEESVQNFYIAENGDQKGYTRYGDWYGVEYGDWCAMFASFCLSYAGIENYPLHCNCARWIDMLQESGMYVETETCTPRPGDLVFLDYGRKSTTDQIKTANADHVGIVAEVIPATREEPAKIVTIEGNHNDCVCYETRDLEDPKIIGYGLLPDGPAATYSCGQKMHTHEAACYDEEQTLICPEQEHIHDGICRSRNLQFEDETVRVDITLTNAVYVPENLSLKVTLIPEDRVSPNGTMMIAAADAMAAHSAELEEVRFCRMELLADGQPYQLPVGVQADVQISFAQPVFTAEAVSNAAQLHTFMLVKDAQKQYRAEAVFEDGYETAEDGITGLYFSSGHISAFALALAGTTQDGGF